MGLKLHIGADSVSEPYGSRTPTDEVLKHLDRKYGLLAHFIKMHETEIADIAAAGMQKLIEARMRGDRGHHYGAMITAGDKIARLLEHDIVSRKFDGLPGIPVQAAIDGKVMFGTRHRKTGRLPRISGRPSSVFSMTMLGSLRAWFTDSTGQFAPKK